MPTRHIRYDNLKPAVNQICTGRGRVESERWLTFRAHDGFDTRPLRSWSRICPMTPTAAQRAMNP
ncbi:hypothetical protein ACFYW8_35510 [Streptomyces sp. NPDC002742]|uniref:hypothetical protein n=1 Tax=Streptomyces sp. NPDC002742 TaxID=3364663 RepID=UPI00369DECD3